jgi:hypothetical protein
MMRETVDITLSEAEDFLNTFRSYDGSVGDEILDCCIELMQRAEVIGERLEDYGNFSGVTADEIAEYILTGEDWV